VSDHLSFWFLYLFLSFLFSCNLVCTQCLSSMAARPSSLSLHTNNSMQGNRTITTLIYAIHQH
jgi:hypothetical protein